VIHEGCYAGGREAAAVLSAEAYFHRLLGTYEKCVDLVLAPSHFAKQKLIENGWSNDKIQVLPHFQNLPLTSKPHPGRDAPILYFGRLSAEKGVSDLICAMSRLPGIRLQVAGEGPQRQELEIAGRNLKLDKVTFVGHVSGSALETLIGESRFTVFPSRAYETLGKSILESYAQGRTVVASDLGSRRELVEEGETGLLFRVKDIDQLAAAISFLHDRPDLSKQMGEAGRAMARARHSQEEHLLALGRIYEQLATKSFAAPKASYPSILQGSRKPPSRQPLRIAYIGGRGVIQKYSGIETYYEETGRRLAEMGHEITIYCRTYFTPPITSDHGVRIVRLPTLRSKHLETLVHTFLSTIHACFGHHDIVHYQTLGPSLLSFLPRFFGKRTVVTVQGLDWQRKKWGWFARQVLKRGEWASAKLPNKTAVVSRTLQEHYLSRYSKQTSCIPNGTEIREPRHGEHLNSFGIKPGEYVLFLGRFSPEKNCHLLIDAFAKTDTPMKLVLAGGSSYTEDYATSVRDRSDKRIKVLDWLSGDVLEEVLTNAALFVLPSDLEGSSLALLDAMGAGVCALASDTP